MPVVCLVSVFLGICSYTDIKKQQIYIWVLMLFGMADIVYWFVSGNWITGMAGCVPGLIVLLFAHWSNQIGRGDGWMLVVMGGMTGLKLAVEVVLSSMVLCIVTTILLHFWKHREWNKAIPLAPFLLSAYWISIL